MEFIEFSPAIKEEWDEVVYNSNDGWAFSLSSWLTMVTPIWKMENCSFAIRENGKLITVMPLHWLPESKRLGSGGWGHGGPVILSSVSSTDRKRLWHACISRTKEIAAEVKAEHIAVSISPITHSSLSNRWSINPLISAGFQDVSTHTWITNLTLSDAELWRRLSENARRKIKQAKSSGYTVQHFPWNKMVDTYYQAHVETYNRTGVSPHPKAYFEGIAQQPEQHYLLWVGMSSENIPIAFHNTARFGKAATYHTGCSYTSHLTSGINYLLFWEAMLGAKKQGCDWYEPGEAFPGTTDNKKRGLSEFKSKFGGELHRMFRAEMILENPRSAGLQPASSSHLLPNPTFRKSLYSWLRATRDLVSYLCGERIMRVLTTLWFWMSRILKGESLKTNTEQPQRQNTRALFSQEGIYGEETISFTPSTDSNTYSEHLLRIRLDIVDQLSSDAKLLDIACANGKHLLSFRNQIERGIGIDFSMPYIRRAENTKQITNVQNVEFVCCEADQLPFIDNYYDLAYSFSSLYIMPEVAEVISEIGRVLKTGGKCVLDFGNKYSLNTIVNKEYHEKKGWAETFPLSVVAMRRVISEANLRIIDHRAFQVLPLWADRPKWLKPFLLPSWNRIMSRQVRGKMIDEWISNLPILKYFVFRHIFICEKY